MRAEYLVEAPVKTVIARLRRAASEAIPCAHEYELTDTCRCGPQGAYEFRLILLPKEGDVQQALCHPSERIAGVVLVAAVAGGRRWVAIGCVPFLARWLGALTDRLTNDSPEAIALWSPTDRE